MSQIFSSNGTVYPVTIIEAGPCTVTQIKTADSDGYNSIQLGYKDTSENKLTKPIIGHYKKANSNMKRFLKDLKTVQTIIIFFISFLRAEVRLLFSQKLYVSI